MIITDVTVTTPTGQKITFRGAATREPKMIPSGQGFMEFTSALGTPLGIVCFQPGLVIEYTNPTAATSQVDASSGMLKVASETDSMEDGV